ncbi:MAG: GH32 C-terminal domain-containing protein [Candidatus Hydrogenedentes bacterium]|nr:GH32 C-terminal domain-containing protein [Candidatus Hydrogenedentota bacterium]
MAGSAMMVAVVVAGAGARPGEAETMPDIADKTLVAWVRLANTDQHGGSALCLDGQDSRFDAIVFGEIARGRWMAGSDHWNRTLRQQDACPAETAGPDELVQVAIVYRGAEVAVFRNAQPYSTHTIGAPASFGPRSVAIMGLRHIEAGDKACFAGAIHDARIYDRPLTAEQIAGLEPHVASEPPPLAWWSFQDGTVADRMGAFTDVLLVGDARVHDGALHLDGDGDFLVAARAGQAAQWLDSSAPGARGDEAFAAVRAHRAALLADPNRPAYHFVTPEGYCMPFDPNGALFWRGKYHLCYIFQDERGHCWGHASSTDLVHWRFHPAALFPAPGDPDQGIFSGNCFVNLKGEATMLYHGVNAGNCIATSAEDDLIHFTKLPSNPIVPNPAEGSPESRLYRSWDPHGWVEGDTYYAIFGGHPGSGATATLFRSKDMLDWEYLHPILDHDMPGVHPDDDISCPDFFALGDRHMLLCISHKRGCRYYLGRWENETFYPESHAWMNWPGGTFFAPESLLDGQGRRIMWAWVLDRRPREEALRTGWSGTMSLPRHLWLGDDGALRMAPVTELEMLRMNPRHTKDLRLVDGAPLPLEDVRGDCLELDFDIDPGDAAQVGLKVRCSPGGEEETVIVYDAAAKCLRIDLAKSTLDPRIAYLSYVMSGDNPPVTAQEAPFELAPGERLRLRVFLDRSIIEVFANERQAVVQRAYPTRDDSLGVALFATGGPATLVSADAWDMAPANPW